MSDKKPMQAAGSKADTEGQPGTGRDGAGESGGGGYPNPHEGKDGQPGGPDRFLGHGGQTDMDYSGPGQLAGKDVEEDGRTGQGG